MRCEASAKCCRVIVKCPTMIRGNVLPEEELGSGDDHEGCLQKLEMRLRHVLGTCEDESRQDLFF